jgi:hypothetical protein
MNLHIIITSLVVIAFIAIMVWSMIGLSNASAAFYKGLQEIEDKAKAATTSEELIAIHREFVRYANAKAVVRHYGDAARKLDSYIRGKLEGIKIK